jgi:hypothetical protein
MDMAGGLRTQADYACPDNTLTGAELAEHLQDERE